jgi:quercetin dioxygenase-like cupin family protein
MWRRKLYAASVAAVVALAYAPGAAVAARQAAVQHEKRAIVKPAPDVQWSAGPPSLPPGAEMAVLEGDPSKAAMFTMRLKLPAGYRIPPHTHPKTERVTVLSGNVGFGMGRDFYESKLQTLSAGSFFVLDPGMPHFVQASEETVVQLNAMGPWSIKYIRASDDPRHRPQARRPPAR